MNNHYQKERSGLRRPLVAIMMTMCATSLVFASDFVVDGIHYNRMNYYDEESDSYGVSDDMVTVSKYEDDIKYAGDIVIPEKISVDGQEYTVRTIESDAFYYCDELTSVQLPGTITFIDKSAFKNCKNLSAINLPNSIVYISDWVFYNTGLTEVTLPQNLTSIQSDTFYGCRNLTKVVLSDGLTTIGDRAFGRCYALKEFTIPQSVTSIGENAFERVSFTEFTSLNPVPPTISSNTFSSSEMLKVPNADAYRNDATWSAAFQSIVELPSEVDGSMYTITSKNDHTCILERLAEQPTATVRIPETVNIEGEEYTIISLGEDVLSENTGVETLVIPGSIAALPDNISTPLSNLKNLTIEDSETVLDFGSSAKFVNSPFETVYLGRDITWNDAVSPFQSNETLTKVKFGQTSINIDDYMFYNCKALSTIEGGENVETIGGMAFKDCDALTSVQFNNAKIIGEDAFYDCDALSSVEAGSVETIGNYAFYNCGALTSVQFNNAKAIGSFAFYDCGALSSVEADAVETIGKSAFANCNVLASALFGDNLKTISNWAFSGCDKLETIKLGNSLETIGRGAFSGCEQLRQIDLPETVSEIGESAFSSCYGLSGLLTIPTGMKTVNASAFSGTNYTVCEMPSNEFVALNGTERISHVETIIVPSDLANTYRDSNWGEMYDFVSNSGITVSVNVTAPGNLAKDIVSQTRKAPASVNKLIITGGQLNQDDFNVIKSNMTACFEIDMSAADCADIYENAFNGKKVIKSIVLPNNATSIGEYAFSGCTILNSVLASDNMKKVAESAFSWCMELKKVDLGDNVSEIGGSAFANAYNLKDFRVPSALTTIGEYAFCNAGKLESIVLGSNVRSIGEYAFVNCNSLSDFSMPNTITSIGEGALSNTAITDIDLSEFNYLTVIPNSLFNGSLQLQSVVFPKNVSSVGNSAFKDCTQLVDADFSETELSKIGEYAFSGCTSLASISLPESTTNIADGAFESCRKLRNINILAVTPPSAYKNTFKNVANEVCTVSIPTDSFYDYLLAQYWGSFVDLKSSFDIHSDDKDVEIAYEVFDNEDDAVAVEPANEVRGVSTRAKAASSNVLSNGVSLFVNADKTVRFHFDVNGGKEILQVLLNEVDVLDRVVNGYLVLSEFEDVNTLKVVTNSAGVSEAIVADEITANTVVNVYNMSGVQVMKGVEMGSISGLNAGVYIVRTAGAVKKIVIR
jgi:hypothetical protein